jgi:predicted nucleotidyltransferase
MSNESTGTGARVDMLAKLTGAPGVLDLAPSHLALVRTILREQLPELEVRAFGSRVTGHAKPFSDLDLIVISPVGLPAPVCAHVADAFAESNLPFKVDIVDASEADPSFRARALARSVLVQSSGSRPGSIWRRCGRTLDSSTNGVSPADKTSTANSKRCCNDVMGQ